MIFFPQPVKGFQIKLATEFESGNFKVKRSDEGKFFVLHCCCDFRKKL